MSTIDEIKQSARGWALDSTKEEIEHLIAQMRMFLDFSKDSQYLITVQARYIVELDVLDNYVSNLK